MSTFLILSSVPVLFPAAGVIARAVTSAEEVLSLLTAPKASADKQSKVRPACVRARVCVCN